MYPVFRKSLFHHFSYGTDTVTAWGEYGLGQPTNMSYAMHSYFNDSQSAGYHGTE